MSAFSERMNHIKKETFVAMGISVGIRLRLFDAMAEMDRPVTATELATKTTCKERYIQQWLGFMACSDIINFEEDDSGEEKFSIPNDRLPHLSTDTGDSNAMWMYGLPILTGVQCQLESCFQKEGPNGIPHESYGGFNEFLDLYGRYGYAEKLIENTLMEVPDVAKQLEQGILMCEIGCGTGFLLQTMAKKYPRSQFLGLDIAARAIDSANKEARENGIKNVQFEVHDAHKLPSDWTEKYNYVFLTDVIHDVPDPTKVLQEIKRVLKPAGTASIQDFPLRRRVADNLKSPSANTGYLVGMFYCIPACMNYGGPGYGPAWGVENWVEVMKDAGFNVKLCMENSAHFVCSK
ncbi:uncharacterized protein LOC106170032 isoform X1 [Lingula anatina]|uniref:Uncharacterized protein LOC106170032 isoform X1 n=2 Tax=Lingula anatina TaxID=7574 RepID=A0A1S3J483_LINAN|nr:uncharacterized protein LOC106170032 isoform X1 [Lingula anatina]|eukprot:XP_013405195.1 uncharacterized protein LOC106170032 isoform X1 [Lingula anatina]